jgi:RNA polymerase sigma-32 factor
MAGKRTRAGDGAKAAEKAAATPEDVVEAVLEPADPDEAGLDPDADGDSEADVLELAELDPDAELVVDDGPVDLDLSEIEAEIAAPRKRGVPAVRSNMPESLSALNVYLAHLKTVAILPIEQQAELAVRFQATGDKAAATALVASNLRLVVKIAFQFRRQWADVMDLIAEGNLGLAEAIRKFDATRGIPFPSYARFWIRARILAFIQENKHLIHAGSRAARKLFWRLERERRQLISEGFDPEPKRLADRLGVREEDVRELAPILDQRPVSLDVPVHGDEEGRTRGDVLADNSMASPEEWTSNEENSAGLRKIFAEFRETLDDRERAIWDSRLIADDGVRLEDLGDAFGVSKERVRQLEMRIKKRLKEFVQRRLGDDVIIEALG